MEVMIKITLNRIGQISTVRYMQYVSLHPFYMCLFKHFFILNLPVFLSFVSLPLHQSSSQDNNFYFKKKLASTVSYKKKFTLT